MCGGDFILGQSPRWDTRKSSLMGIDLGRAGWPLPSLATALAARPLAASVLGAWVLSIFSEKRWEFMFHFGLRISYYGPDFQRIIFPGTNSTAITRSSFLNKRTGLNWNWTNFTNAMPLAVLHYTSSWHFLLSCTTHTRLLWYVRTWLALIVRVPSE
jgi:hypothetical protein